MKTYRYLRNLLKFAFRHNPSLWIALAFSLISVLFELLATSTLFPLTALAAHQEYVDSQWTVRLLSHFGIRSDVHMYFTAFLIFFALRVGTLLISQGMLAYLGRRLLAQMVSTAFGNILSRSSIQDLERKSIGYYISLAGDEANRASAVLVMVCQFLSAALLTALYFAAIISYSWQGATGIGLFLALGSVGLLLTSRKAHQLGAIQADQSRAANSLFLESLNGIKSLRAFLAEGYICRRFTAEIYTYTQTLFKIDFIQLASKLAPVLILLSAAIGMVEYMRTAGGKALDVAFLVSMTALLMRFFPVVGQSVSIVLRIFSDASAGDDVTELLQPVTQSRNSASRRIIEPIRSIQINQLQFGYAEDTPILRDFNATFTAGKSYALSGPSGSGKSTFVDLLLKFHQPQKGSVEINGDPISELGDQSIRQHITVLGQRPLVFNDTIRRNICLNWEPSDEELNRAVDAAQLTSVIASLPNALDTILTYQGGNISGGQVQRMAIARALLRNSSVLILDESMSALDLSTRLAILEDIKKMYRERILIVVTHDSAITERLDEVILLPKIATTAAIDKP